MKLGLRTKVFLVTLALIGCVGVATGAVLETLLRGQLSRRIEGEVTRHALTARAVLESQSADATVEDVDRWADRLGETTVARVTVIGSDGLLLGDSALTVEEVRAAGDHGNRPEVLAAERDGSGVSRRHSDTLGTDMLYVAVPLAQRQRGGGVVRVALPLAEIDDAVGELRTRLALVGLLGLIVAVLISGVASQLLTRRLRELVEQMRKLNRSHSDAAQEPRASDELDRLAGSLTAMDAELKTAIAKLSDERDRLQTILEGMTDGVLAVDADGCVTLANPGALALLGLDNALVGEPIVQAVQATAVTELVSQSQNADGCAVEFELERDPPRQVLARAAPLRSTGGTVLVMQDVTDMRRLETIRRDFVANVSHELRTPVSVVRANAETLLAGALDDPSARSFVEAIERNAERLTALIADLLDLSRIEAGSYRLQLEAVSLPEAFERATAALDELGCERGINVTTEVDADLVAWADPGCLDQILLNLLDNALKYSQEGGQIELRGRAQDDGVRIEVCDDGPGIEAACRERIFERFYRVDRSRSREAGGTGLGLAIVKHLANAMHGEVGVEPSAAGGSRFWVSLPSAPERA